MRSNKFGNYKLFRTLGEGAFAKVKRNQIFFIILKLILNIVGIHEKIGQKISAKIIQKSTIKSKELEEKVKREIRFSKYFRHPNIIHLYEVIETQNEIIMIMEYASGGELFDLICRGQVIKYIYNILLNIVIRK